MNSQGGTSARGEQNDGFPMDEGDVGEVESLNSNKTFSEFSGFDRANEATGFNGGVPLQYDGIDFDMLREEHLVGKEFKTVEDAEMFYKEYGKGVGFGVRRNDIQYGQNGRVTRRVWVCSKEGERDQNRRLQVTPAGGGKRRTRALTRENCKAVFKIKYTKEKDCYIVTQFNPYHSHCLTFAKDATFLPSSRNVPVAHLAQAPSMPKASLRTCHSYDSMVDQSVGYGNIGFTTKDIDNKLDSEHRAILPEGDAKAALDYVLSGLVPHESINMPPWMITLPGWEPNSGPRYCEIERGVQTPYNKLPDNARYVTAETAKTLLDMISGLSTLAYKLVEEGKQEIERARKDNGAGGRITDVGNLSGYDHNIRVSGL